MLWMKFIRNATNSFDLFSAITKNPYKGQFAFYMGL